MLQQFNQLVAGVIGDDFQASLSSSRRSSRLDDPASFSLQFSYADLFMATGGFSRENKLGSGGSGEVFRGCLRGGTEVAVKVLSDASGVNGFEDELLVLSRFRHPNLVTLLGWGQHDHVADTKYLIYELLKGGDVGRRLYMCKLRRAVFPWQHRLSIALDASCGVSYMVNSQPKAFHRDIKTSNILIDASGNGKMADFGLAGITRDQGQTSLSVEYIGGTPGYMCPEFMQSGQVTEHSEVFSMGMVFLELLLNELPAQKGSQGDIIFPIMEIVQPGPGALDRLLANLDSHAQWERPFVDEFAQLAFRCIHSQPLHRPSFAEIVADLRRLIQCVMSSQTEQAAVSSPVFTKSPEPDALRGKDLEASTLPRALETVYERAGDQMMTRIPQQIRFGPKLSAGPSTKPICAACEERVPEQQRSIFLNDLPPPCFVISDGELLTHRTSAMKDFGTTIPDEEPIPSLPTPSQV